MINKHDQAEFIGQIIDIFEDFTASKHENPHEVCIEGEAYDNLAADLRNVMKNWGIFASSDHALFDFRILENIVELSTMFQYFRDREELFYEDPETEEPTALLFKHEVGRWAVEFDNGFQDPDEYYFEIERFAEEKFASQGWLIPKKEE